jgi:poly-gamma-glutamate capsule biosynthesis protein CapA/YwtB (metallophosphatase superfamily)
VRKPATGVVLVFLLAACSGGQRPVLGGPTTTGAVPSRAAATSTPTPTPTPTPTGPPAVTLAFSGDMLVSDELRAQAARNAGGSGFDFGPMLREVAPVIKAADWAVCHQETPISADNSALSGYPTFSAPYQLATAEKAAGYDACTTASNHTVDKGLGGIESTLDTFDRVGIRHVGSARNAAEARKFAIYTVRGVHIGHLAYAYGLNGIPAPTPWAVNLIDPARIRADAAAIRAAGAQFVVVSLHFGTEKDQTPTAYQREVADAVMRSPDVDLIIGHHAHVVQPVQRRPDGRWVVFGLGNLLAQQALMPGEGTAPPHRDGVVVRVTIAAGPSGRYAVRRVGYVPTFVQAPQDVVELAPPASRARTSAVLRSMGAPIADDTPP